MPFRLPNPPDPAGPIFIILSILGFHRRDAEIAESSFFSFVAETPTNENPQPLRGRINPFKIKRLYEGLSHDLAIWFDSIKLLTHP
jgi:hypothetical protein